MNDPFDMKLAPSNEAINALVVQAEELLELENEIAEVEARLKALSGRANELKTQIIPDKMAEIGLSEFSLAGGGRVKVEDFVSGSLPKDPTKREDALSWLEKNDAGDIIKDSVVMEFGKEQHDTAIRIAQQLQEYGYDAQVTSSVHPQTYLACMREMLRQGKSIDPERMGIFIGRRAKVVGK